MSRFLSIAILAAALSVAAPFAAQGAGLGRLTVQSALGQPLMAEIELVLAPGEDDGLSARLASPEAFQQAGIEPNMALNSMRLSIERRNGRPFVRLTSSQPVNEPFVEMLIELQWNTGRLVREYTFLLDPPEYKAPAVAAAPAPKPAPVDKPVAVEPKPAPGPVAKPLAPTPSPAAAPAGSYEVKQGDTLAGIARQHLPAGVSLNQMLIAIYRANQDAFIRENINLVRAGRVLNIPGSQDAGGITTEEANRVVKSHMGEFSEYRNRLAAAPSAAEAAPGQRAVAGRIESKPSAKPAPQGDQLRLSRADPAKPAADRAARGDDLAARERALKEAQSRVADLEKNVADLQKLLEIRNQQLAELEKKAGAKPAPAAPVAAAPKPEAKPEAKAEAKPAAPAPAKPEAPKPEAAKPAPPAPAPAPAPTADAKKDEPQKADAKKDEGKKAEAKKDAAKPKPAPQPEPSLVDEFLDNPVALGGLAGVILLLVVYGIWAWRRKKAAQAKFQDSVLGAAASAGGASVFGAPAAAPATDTAAAAAPLTAQPEEVDPIAEADVYMAYGRDAQAEEILKEALAKDANRLPVHMKLLEIYANRKDAKSFEQTALKVKQITNGSGPDWDKAAALGASIDPQNGLYGGASGAPVAAAAAAGAAAGAAAAAPTLDFDIGGGGQPQAPAPDISLDEPKQDGGVGSIDFDLGAATTPGAPPAEEKSDFTPEGTLIMGKETPDSTVAGLDFDLNLGGDTKAPEPSAPAEQAPAAEPSGGLDFDLDLGGDDKPAEPASAENAPMDLSSISLDLGSPGEPSVSGGSGDPKWQEVATKLDLAKAYEEMGDKDGARELLNEVMKDGDAAQKGQAQQLLAKIA
ncbi:MAG TPA: FimV/HubP family polar landmark protein [Burkholderiales bacterium]|nr:FimV/HubP family polar landmark protein [Burkholderiales bacterium]